MPLDISSGTSSSTPVSCPPSHQGQHGGKSKHKQKVNLILFHFIWILFLINCELVEKEKLEKILKIESLAFNVTNQSAVKNCAKVQKYKN